MSWLESQHALEGECVIVMCLCNIPPSSDRHSRQSTGETEQGVSNTEEDEHYSVVVLEDSELCDMLEANSEERVFQEMLQLDAIGFDEELNLEYKKFPIATML